MKNKILIILIAASFFSFGQTFLLQAATLTEYHLLAPIPVGNNNTVVETTNAQTFIPGLVRLVIMLATGLATLFIIYGGIQYMSTDAFSGKEDAKNTIENALWGLFLVMSAWLILNTINPNLVKFDLSIERQETPQDFNKPGGGGPSASTGGLQASMNNAITGLNAACSNCTIRITSTTGDEHDPKSLHYQGLAVDIGADTNLTKYLTGQTTNPKACATYAKTLNGVSSLFKWEPTGEKCGGAVASTGDHWHMSVAP